MIFWIGIGGIAGALSRYCIGIWFRHRAGSPFPWATLLINLTGSLALGLLAGSEGHIPEDVYAILGTGFCGAFTTFSTFGYEAVTLAGSKRYKDAVLYVTLSVVLGLAGAWAGMSITA